MKAEVTLFCENVSRNHVHCNRYTTIDVQQLNRSIDEVIEETEWSYNNKRKILCPAHKDE